MQLTPGYLGKVLGLAQVKNIGFDTMWKILDGIGYRLAVIEHLDLAAAIDEIGDDYRPRVVTGVKPGTQVRGRLHPAVMKEAARLHRAMAKGVQKTFCISRARLRKLRQHAANVRWARHRARSG